MKQEQDVKEHKKELKLKWNHVNKKWEVLNAKGFYPDVDAYTIEELRLFLRANEDVKPNLMY